MLCSWSRTCLVLSMRRCRPSLAARGARLRFPSPPHESRQRQRLVRGGGLRRCSRRRGVEARGRAEGRRGRQASSVHVGSRTTWVDCKVDLCRGGPLQPCDESLLGPGHRLEALPRQQGRHLRPPSRAGRRRILPRG
eukprot:1752584-Prymnesium_polylepis.2